MSDTGIFKMDLAEQLIDPTATVKMEVIRSHHGDKITVRTKFNVKLNRDVEHIEISARTVTLPIVTEKRMDEEFFRREPYDFGNNS
jgi:hypothetical protein